jgi:hypothetical protein
LAINAQIIVLKKNGTLKKYTIELPNKMKVKYQTDAVEMNFKAKVVGYKFPNMEILVKKDTLTIDVRKIMEVKYTSDAVVFYYGTAFVISFLFLPMFFISIHEKIFDAAIVAAGLVTGAYFIAKQGKRTFNTKTEWRFE